MKKLIPTLLLLLFALSALPAWADAPLKIGVLAFRPKVQTMEQWQPLAAYLESALGQRVELTAYDHQELEAAVAQKAVDVVFTSPGHYVLLQHRHPLSAPLATQITQEGEYELTTLGGVIFTRAETSTINSLADLGGKRIAAISTEALGAYQAQALELLEAGVVLPGKDKLIFIGQPHHLVVKEVLSGRADVGFVRTGLLEALVHEGKLDLGRIKIINRQNLPSFPYISSTRLYPEWPMAVMPQVDEQLARRLAVALFSLPSDSAAAHAAGIYGFTIPADYNVVEELLSRLRLPPFDVAPPFTLADLWKKYASWITALGLLFVLLVLIATALFKANGSRRRSEERLQRMMHEQHIILDNIGVGVVQLKNRKITWINPAMAKMFGYSVAELLSQDTDLLYLDQTEYQEIGEKAYPTLALGKLYTFQTQMKRKNGSSFWCTLIGQAIDPEDLRQGTIWILEDVNERQQAKKKLQESEENYRFLFDGAGDAIFIHDEEARILAVNQRVVEQFGYTSAELMSITIDQVDSPEESRHIPQRITRLMEQGHLTFETVHQRKDGSLIPTEVTARRIVWNGKQAIISICRDITERKLLEAEKARLEAQYQQLQKAESLGRMAGAIAHNFNNLLMAVMGNLELAMGSLSRDADPMTMLTAAMKAASRAAELSGSMLTYLGQTPVGHEPLNLSEACRQSLPLLRATMPEGVELEVDLPSTGPTIKANESQLQQILTTLLTNGREAIGEGGGTIRLAVKTVSMADIPGTHRFPLDWQPQDNCYGCLEVTDSGCGIAEKDIDALFDPFFTTKFTGRGLGLSVVLGIVRAHGGGITVESEVGRGSLFLVFLPMAADG